MNMSGIYATINRSGQGPSEKVRSRLRRFALQRSSQPPQSPYSASFIIDRISPLHRGGSCDPAARRHHVLSIAHGHSVRFPSSRMHHRRQINIQGQ